MSTIERKASAPNLPEYLQVVITKELKRLGFARENPKSLAECVRKLSDYYIDKPSAVTPWDQAWTQAAYISYFLPLNYIRVRKALERLKPTQFLEPIESISDFGSGPGTAALAILDAHGHQKNIHCIEQSPIAHKIGEAFFDAQSLTTPTYSTQISKTRNQLIVASYSLTELDAVPQFFFEHENILLIEPSTKLDSRRLIRFRSDFLAAEFHVWAPCCHEKVCPLADSERDWCHDRTEWNMPDWFRGIEEHLPIKNRTLSFSYLAVSRRHSPGSSTQLARVTGDQQTFKGFTKQMICRDSKREFISWQKRDFKYPPPLYRGELCTIEGPTKDVANEVRPAPATQVRVID